MITRTHSPNGNSSPAALDLGVRLLDRVYAAATAEQMLIANIFVGGSGKRVFRQMLAQCDGQLPDKMFALAIDSDPDPGNLPPESLVTLTLPQADLVVERRRDWPSIDRSLPAVYKAGKVAHGSMMKRMVSGGLLLPYYRTRLRQELHKRLVRPMLNLGGVGEGQLRGGRCRILVNLVGSLGGGFGSGCRDEIPAQVRDLFRRVHEAIVVEIVWHAFTPNVHRDVLPLEWQKSRSDANGFAFLVEFEAGYHDPERVPWASLGVRPFAGPLVNKVRLYDPANEQGALLTRVEDMYGMVATVLLTESLAALGDTLGGHEANDLEGGLCTRENATAPYGSAAAHRLVFPAGKIARYASLDALRRLVQTALVGKRLADHERTARERYQASGLANLAGRLAAELRLVTPEVSSLVGRQEWATAAEVLLAARRDLEQTRLPRLERRAAEMVEALGGEMAAGLESAWREMLASPSRHTPPDVVAVFDGILGGADESLRRARDELAGIDLPALARQFEGSLGQLRETVLQPALFKGRKVRRAHLRAGSELAGYAAACHRALLLRARADVLARVRPTLLALAAHARAIAQAGQAAARSLEALAHEARACIGRHGLFVRDAVDADWADACLRRLFDGTDWDRWADELFGAQLHRLKTRKALEDFLNDDCARALEEVVRPKLAVYHVTSDDMIAAAEAWLREVLAKAAPQFSFHEQRCGEHGQTYFNRLLAVGSREAADRLLQEFPNQEVAVVETGDPHQLVFTAQRRLVPLHAAINNLESMEREYRHWIALTADNPQAEVHLNRAYIEMDRAPVINRMLNRREVTDEQ